MDTPITFNHNGKKYTGHFGKVAGAGQDGVWHLHDQKNFYLGRLRFSHFDKKWVFDPTPKTMDLESLASFFGEYVTSRDV